MVILCRIVEVELVLPPLTPAAPSQVISMTQRKQEPACNFSKASLMSFRLTVPLINLSTGSYFER